jgi:single-strand DNA-binding protein
MNAIKNKVQLIGHLGLHPEIRVFESGTKIARMRMATNESYKNSDGERITETMWHQLVAWGHLADIAEKYLQKGSELMIEGKLTNRQYTDKEGITRYVTEIQVSELLMLDKKGSKSSS